MDRTWDAIIIGAGPAGSSAASRLGKLGVKALLLDKSRFPRDKVCGDACSPRAVRMLERLGVLPRIEGRRKAIRDIRVYFDEQRVVSAQVPPTVFGGSGYVLPRMDLDKLLLENAIRCGTCFQPGREVRSVEVGKRGAALVLKGGERLHSRLVIGADGAYSLVRRALGIEPNHPRDGAWAVRAYYEGVEAGRHDTLEFVWKKSLQPGYGWLFPTGGGRVNVGFGMRADHLNRRGEKLPEMFDRFLQDDPRIGERVRRGRLLGKLRGHYLPMASRRLRSFGDRILLAGDAASLINPLSGEGIEFALESGWLAAESSMRALERGDFRALALRKYQYKWTRAFGSNLRLNSRLSRLASFPSLVGRVLAAAERDPLVADELVEIIFGDARRISVRLAWRTLQELASQAKAGRR